MCGEARLPLQVWADPPIWTLTLPSPPTIQGSQAPGTPPWQYLPHQGWGPPRLCPHFSAAEACEVWRGEDTPQERRCSVLWTGGPASQRPVAPREGLCRGWGWLSRSWTLHVGLMGSDCVSRWALSVFGCMCTHTCGPCVVQRSLGGWEVLTLPLAFASAQMSTEDDGAGSGLCWPSAQRPWAPVGAGVGLSALGKLPCLPRVLSCHSCCQCSPRRQLEPGPSASREQAPAGRGKGCESLSTKLPTRELGALRRV